MPMTDQTLDSRSFTVPTDDFAATTATTGFVGTNSSTIGNIETFGDRDWFEIQLVAGETYIFDLRSAPTNNGTLPDAFLSLLDGSGNQLLFDDDGGISFDSRIAFTASSTGTFFLEAGAFGDSFTGSYVISVETPGDDLVPNEATVGTISVGSASTARIETAGESDWFAIELIEGHRYTFNQFGSAHDSSNTLRDPLMQIFDPNSIFIGRNDDSGGTFDSSFSFVASVSGTYFLDASGFGSSIGTYRVLVEEGFTPRQRSGNDGDNFIAGRRGPDAIFGRDGDDTLVGRNGGDFLFGGNDDDILRGGRGTDVLEGGFGRDVMNGNGGRDTFVFRDAFESAVGSNRDVIVNFRSGVDTIDLQSIQRGMSFIGTGDYSGAIGEVRYDQFTGILSGDLNGDMEDDFQIELSRAPSIDFGDLIL